MKISLDSNAWEKIFDLQYERYVSLRNAFRNNTLRGYICETAFRIEAIRKVDRPEYFGHPKMGVSMSLKPQVDGRVVLSASFGPDDAKHPGIPVAQEERLNCALEHGVRIMRGIAWLGLPSPIDPTRPDLFVTESIPERGERDQCRADLSAALMDRGVGRHAFEEMDGWELENTAAVSSKKFAKACAEWSDGELVIAHVCHGNDAICTNDLAKGTGASVFDAENRQWLKETYGVRFLTIDELPENHP